jgi:hypothetical protein
MTVVGFWMGLRIRAAILILGGIATTSAHPRDGGDPEATD